MELGERRRILGEIRYPADPDRMVVDLRAAGAPPDLLAAVGNLRDRMYMETDDVERALDDAPSTPA